MRPAPVESAFKCVIDGVGKDAQCALDNCDCPRVLASYVETQERHINTMVTRAVSSEALDCAIAHDHIRSLQIELAGMKRIAALEEKIEAVLNAPVPKDVKLFKYWENMAAARGLQLARAKEEIIRLKAELQTEDA